MVISMTSSNEPEKALLTIKEAASKLHGVDYTVSDLNRLYRMIKSQEIVSTLLAGRKFIPAWQVEKLAQGGVEHG